MTLLPRHAIDLLKRYKPAVVYYTAIVVTVGVLKLFGII